LLSKKRLMDIGLVIIILAMGVFVYFQIARIVGDVRNKIQDTESPQTVVEAETPTTSPEPDDRQDAREALDFELTSVEGETVRFADFRGMAVMINFWATWCPPCRAELPLIESFAVQHAEELAVLAVNSGEDRETVVQFVNEFNYDLVFLLNPSNSLATEYQVRGLPTTIFINEEGFIEAVHVGLLNENLLTDYLNQVGVTE